MKFNRKKQYITKNKDWKYIKRHEDDFVQSRIALRSMIDGFVFKEATNAQE